MLSFKYHLSDTVNDHKTPKKLRAYSRSKVIDYKAYEYGEWKIQWLMSSSFASFLKIHTLYTRSDNIEIMMGSETNNNIGGFFKSLLQKYQEKLKESMNGS